MTEVINIWAPSWDPAESYGRIALELAHHLGTQGVKVNPFGSQRPNLGTISPTIGGILMAYPSNFHQFGTMAQAGPRVALTMFESTQLPPGWTTVLNGCEAVIVPSTFLLKVFRDYGVTVPIHVIPLGVSRAFKYVQRPVRKPFTFLAFADRGRRKGFHIAGWAFHKAFGDDLNYRLILKAREGALERVASISNPNMELIRGDYTDRQLAKLYSQVDCMVFPSCGEGFGLPPREFAATGGTVIATNWGGLADDLSSWGLPIRYSLAPAWKGDEHLEGLGNWAEPDVLDLAETMRHVANHPQYYQERGQDAARFVKAHYSWKTFAKRVLAVWQEVNSGSNRLANRKVS